MFSLKKNDTSISSLQLMIESAMAFPDPTEASKQTSPSYILLIFISAEPESFISINSVRSSHRTPMRPFRLHSLYDKHDCVSIEGSATAVIIIYGLWNPWSCQPIKEYVGIVLKTLKTIAA